MSKNVVRRAIKTVSTEYDIIEKIINALKELYAVGTVSHDENVNADTIIEALDKELDDIGSLDDESINLANDRIREREENGESVSDTLSSVSKSQSVREQRHSDVEEANKRFTNSRRNDNMQNLVKGLYNSNKNSDKKRKNCNKGQSSLSLPNHELRKHEKLLN